MRPGLVGAFISLMGLLAIQCVPGGDLSRPAPDARTAVMATPGAERPTATPETLAKPQSTFAESVGKFGEVRSYRFSMSAVLRTVFEGRTQEWSYKGAGAFAAPDQIEWTLEGQADVYLRVVSSGAKVFCQDARGQNTRDCSLAFGGPRPGSSPFTAIAYLSAHGEVGALDPKSIDGVTYDHFTFAPSLSKVSALDPAHSRALSSVTSVKGEAWIDRKSGLPFRESVVVNSSSPVGEESVEMSLIFSKFNEQVDISLPQ